jgi:hypothetical protein
MHEERVAPGVRCESSQREAVLVAEHQVGPFWPVFVSFLAPFAFVQFDPGPIERIGRWLGLLTISTGLPAEFILGSAVVVVVTAAAVRSARVRVRMTPDRVVVVWTVLGIPYSWKRDETREIDFCEPICWKGMRGWLLPARCHIDDGDDWDGFPELDAVGTARDAERIHEWLANEKSRLLDLWRPPAEA